MCEEAVQIGFGYEAQLRFNIGLKINISVDSTVYNRYKYLGEGNLTTHSPKLFLLLNYVQNQVFNATVHTSKVFLHGLQFFCSQGIF